MLTRASIAVDTFDSGYLRVFFNPSKEIEAHIKEIPGAYLSFIAPCWMVPRLYQTEVESILMNLADEYQAFSDANIDIDLT